MMWLSWFSSLTKIALAVPKRVADNAYDLCRSDGRCRDPACVKAPLIESQDHKSTLHHVLSHLTIRVNMFNRHCEIKSNADHVVACQHREERLHNASLA